MFVASASYTVDKRNPVSGEETSYRGSRTVSGATLAELLAAAMARMRPGEKLDTLLSADGNFEEIWTLRGGWLAGAERPYNPPPGVRHFRDLAVGDVYSTYGFQDDFTWEKIDERHVRLVAGPEGTVAQKEVDPYETI